MANKEKLEYWTCTIGPIDKSKIQWGGDSPLRDAVEDKFIDMFGEQAIRCSSGWGLTPEIEGILSRIRMLYITDPSGETLKKIKEALDENTKRLKRIGL
jgi:hypothetical protein